MAERNRLLISPEDDFAYGVGIPRDATWRNLIPAAELGLAIAPGSGEAMAVRDSWNAAGRGSDAIAAGHYGDAAGNYANALLALGGAIPGAGIIARGTKRGTEWMNRNLPQGFNRLLDAAMPADPKNTMFSGAGPTVKPGNEMRGGTVYLPNSVDPEKLADVKSEMLARGAPTIRVLDNGDHYIALEGSHRLQAASELGITPNYVVLQQDDMVPTKSLDFDLYGLEANPELTAGEIAGEIMGTKNPYLTIDIDGNLVKR